MVMIHFTTTFNLALMIGMMEVIQLTAARILLDINTFQRRQIGGIPAQIPPCAPNCDPVTNILAPGVSLYYLSTRQYLIENLTTR